MSERGVGMGGHAAYCRQGRVMNVKPDMGEKATGTVGGRVSLGDRANKDSTTRDMSELHLP